ncbi:DinB family protein [Holophaga foetida]|uniref:DinB family protein n=1 Tax=Holophaga foetida TaxID=35839 RepID=UPI0002472153|nr:DinB family protein [Holophaga foetida]
MFRRVEDFLACWDEESRGCVRLFQAIPEGAVAQAVGPEHRDLRRLAWHIVECLIEMPGRMGLRLEGADLIQGGFICEPPATMAEICQAYSRASASLVKALGGWSDAALEEKDDMYGETWMRGLSLMVLITHQTHHRGQMTVLMRQAGLQVPDVYGPAKESWGHFGMEPPRV